METEGSNCLWILKFSDQGIFVAVILKHAGNLGVAVSWLFIFS